MLGVGVEPRMAPPPPKGLSMREARDSNLALVAFKITSPCPYIFQNSSTCPLQTVFLFLSVRVIILGLRWFNHFFVEVFLLFLPICRLFVCCMCLYSVQLYHMCFVLLACLCRSWSMQISISVSSLDWTLCRSSGSSVRVLCLFFCLIVCLSPCSCVSWFLLFFVAVYVCFMSDRVLCLHQSLSPCMCMFVCIYSFYVYCVFLSVKVLICRWMSNWLSGVHLSVFGLLCMSILHTL